ncbi:MAG: SDR family oxidoreductase [Dictyoglomus thermophilum]|nr:SDR family oxidoreductase [Dictyoglomus thermophilum]MCX7720403.1 SDR family oxidoreductase [Dictyoglomus thermophilum]
MSNYIVFITGASKGLGFSLTELYLDKGHKVIATYRKNLEKLEEIKNHPNLILHPMDVSDEESVRNAYEYLKNKINYIDILINNAAVYLEDKSKTIENIDIEKAIVTMNVNSIGPLRVLKYFYSLVEKGNKKLIINISSEAGSISNCWRDREYAYCMSKSALNMLSAILQNYSIPKGIKVLSIHPGWMRTDMGGPDADIDPKEAAEGIYNLSVKDWDPKDKNIYMDYKGNLMTW